MDFRAFKKFTFTYMPTLKHAAMFRIAVELWNSGPFDFDVSGWTEEARGRLETLEKDVLPQVHLKNAETQIRVDSLSLPKAVKEDVSRYVEAVAAQVQDWMELHEQSYSDFHRSWMKNIRWFWKGDVDQERTAEALTKDSGLSVTAQYKVARAYCLTDRVETLSRHSRIRRSRRGRRRPEALHHILEFWLNEWKDLIPAVSFDRISFLLRTLDCSSALQKAFLISAFCKNSVAVKFFFQQIHASASEMVLFRKYLSTYVDSIFIQAAHIEPWDNAVKVLAFLFNNVDGIQQLGLLTYRSDVVLSVFGHWPWYGFLHDVLRNARLFQPRYLLERGFDSAESMATLLTYTAKGYRLVGGSFEIFPRECTVDGYLYSIDMLLRTVTKKERTLYADDLECKDIQTKLWSRLNDEEKTIWLTGNYSKWLVCKSLQHKHVLDMPVILSDAIALVKGFILTHDGLRICKKMVKLGEIELLLDFVRDSACSEPEVSQLYGFFRLEVEKMRKKCPRYDEVLESIEKNHSDFYRDVSSAAKLKVVKIREPL